MNTLTVFDVANILKISKISAQRLIRSGEIPGGFKITNKGHWRIGSEDFDKYIVERQNGNRR